LDFLFFSLSLFSLFLSTHVAAAVSASSYSRPVLARATRMPEALREGSPEPRGWGWTTPLGLLFDPTASRCCCVSCSVGRRATDKTQDFFSLSFTLLFFAVVFFFSASTVCYSGFLSASSSEAIRLSTFARARLH